MDGVYNDDSKEGHFQGDKRDLSGRSNFTLKSEEKICHLTFFSQVVGKEGGGLRGCESKCFNEL